jgi:hypothetical protein
MQQAKHYFIGKVKIIHVTLFVSKNLQECVTKIQSEIALKSGTTKPS